MILFDNAEYENFFKPFCCKNKKIYYECILQLIEKSKFVPVLYETDARDTLSSAKVFSKIKIEVILLRFLLRMDEKNISIYAAIYYDKAEICLPQKCVKAA